VEMVASPDYTLWTLRGMCPANEGSFDEMGWSGQYANFLSLPKSTLP